MSRTIGGLTPKLTLNLGVRYSNETRRTASSRGNSVSEVSPCRTTTIPPVPSPVSSPAPRADAWARGHSPRASLWNRDNNNFQPRVGLAWNVEPNTVIRAGFAEMIWIGTWGGPTKARSAAAASITRRSPSRPIPTRRCSISTRVCRRSSQSAEFRRTDPHLGFVAIGAPHDYRGSRQLPQPLYVELECQRSARAQENYVVELS